MPEPADTLLAWYADRARDLPWRAAASVDAEVRAWRTLVSEVMLQQTRVETVIGYYQAFLERFPTVDHLARAPVEEVLRAWAGLGYYDRARHLHAAARAVAARGGFPRTAAGLAELPGLGPYAAGAVASIAWGEDVPAVDGNVRRVAGRLLGVDPAIPTGLRRVEAAVREWLPSGRSGDFNQALMDLGATVCRPRRPRCGACPLAATCVARHSGDPEAIPSRRRRPRPPEEHRVAAVWIVDGAVFLTEREGPGLLAGTWGPPDGPLAPGEAPEAGAERILAEGFGVRARARAGLGAVAHAFTHRRWRVEVVATEAPGEPAVGVGPRWRFLEPRAATAEVALSRLGLKVLEAAGAIAASGAGRPGRIRPGSGRG